MTGRLCWIRDGGAQPSDRVVKKQKGQKGAKGAKGAKGDEGAKRDEDINRV